MLMDASYRSTILHALQEDGVDISERPSLAASPRIPFERAHEHSVSELVDELSRLRSETEKLASGLEPAQFDRTAGNQVFGQLTVLQWLRSFYRHDRMHQAQINGEESDYKPRYIEGAAEPRGRPTEQRRDQP
jgi:hypothetical protein